MKILIIGCNGFIGSALAEFFMQDHVVDGCDITETNINLSNFFKMAPFNSDFASIFKNTPYDCCIYAAGAASVPASVLSPLTDFQSNVANFINLLDALRIYNPECKVLHLSSAAVYGNPVYLPIDELHPVKPVSPYGWHKYQSEIICKEYHTVYKIATCSARIFSAYGPGLKKQILWDLHQKVISNQLTLFGTGNETRDFIYIDDLVKAIALILTHAPFNAEEVNVGNGSEIYIKDLVSTFAESLEHDVKFTFTGNIREGDPINWKADITQISQWGYKKSVDLKEGIKAYIGWLRNDASRASNNSRNEQS